MTEKPESEKWEGFREKLRMAVNEIKSWLPSETESYQKLVYDILWNLSDKYPEELDCVDLGMTELGIGWKEADMLGRVLVEINDREDLEKTLKELYSEEKEE